METSIAEFLKAQLRSRQLKNKNYSLRAYARDLNIGPGRLSDILNGKITIGDRVLKKISENLKLSPAEKCQLDNIFLRQKTNKKTIGNFMRRLSDEEYALIAEPRHYYILALLETSKHKHSVEWIARRLDISVGETNAMLERLVAMGMIQKDKKGKLRTSPGGITTTHDIPSKVIRDSHRAVIQESLKSLEKDPVDSRDFSSITMAANPENIKEAKRLTREYRRRLCKLMETGPKSEVYTLNIQLFRNTQPESSC